jgi:hypothetical protein
LNHNDEISLSVPENKRTLTSFKNKFNLQVFNYYLFLKVFLFFDILHGKEDLKWPNVVKDKYVILRQIGS